MELKIEVELRDVMMEVETWREQRLCVFVFFCLFVFVLEEEL